MKHKRGFSLVEFFISVVIIMILASAAAFNINSHRQTAKQEAEKLFRYLHDLTRRADRNHRDFTIETVGDTAIQWYWSDDTKHKTPIYKKTPGANDRPIISAGFTLAETFADNEIVYNVTENSFKRGDPPDKDANGHFIITRNDGSSPPHYIMIRGGRARLSDSAEDDPDDDDED